MSYNYVGQYDNSTTYYLDNIVSYNNKTFLCVNDISGSGISEVIPVSGKSIEYIGPEILINGSFTGNGDEWNVASSFASITNGVLTAEGFDDYTDITQDVTIKGNTNYRLIIDITENTLTENFYGIYSGIVDEWTISGGTTGIQTLNFTTDSGTESTYWCYLDIGDVHDGIRKIVLNSISLKEIFATDTIFWKLYNPEIEVVKDDRVVFIKKEITRFTTDVYDGPIIIKPRLDKVELPTDSDYKNGYMYRYFFRQSNNTQSDIHEICKKEYDKIANYYFYTTLKIMWKIIGEKPNTLKTNLIIIRNANDKLKGIKDILSQNPLQYWINLPDIISENMDVTDKIIAKRESQIYDLTQEFIKYIKNKTITSSAEYNLIKDEFLRDSEVDAVTVGVLEYSAELDPNRYLTTENDDIILTEDYQAIIVEDRT